MFEKLKKDVKKIDDDMYAILVNIVGHKNDHTKCKPMWLQFNRLYTSRVETLRLMKIAYSMLHSAECVKYIPTKVVIQYCKAKDITIPDIVESQYTTFKDIVKRSKETIR